MASILEQVQNLSAEIIAADPGDASDLQNLVSAVASNETEISENYPRLLPYIDELKKSLGQLESCAETESAQYLEQLGAIVSVLAREVEEEEQSEDLSGSPTENTDEFEFDDTALLFEFLAEQDENLERLEAFALELEKGVDDTTLSELKGVLHTLKGELGVLGLADVAGHCHELEDQLTRPTEDVHSEVILRAIDWVRLRFKAIEQGGDNPAPFIWESQDEIQTTAESKAEVAEARPKVEAFEVPPCFTEGADLVGDQEVATEFVFEAREYLEDVDVQLLTLEKDPADGEAINTIFRAFHTIKGVAAFLELKCLQQLAHVAETMLDSVRNGTIVMIGEPLAVTFDVNDALRQHFDTLEEVILAGGPLQPAPNLPELVCRITSVIRGEPELEVAGTIASSGTASSNLIAEAPIQLDIVESSGSIVEAATPKVSPEPAKAASKATVEPSSKEKAAKPTGSLRETIKVDAQRLDQLVDMIGELVISEAMVSQSDELDLTDRPRLTSLFGHMDKITRELQELAMSLRMVPIRSTFRRMARLARDVAQRLDKPINFVTLGENTDLDKTVVDSIGDPLVHLIRNAVDHGIENDSESRISAGKPPEGRIELRAFHRGGNILIEIEDDGGGLDAEVILAKARERNVVGPDEVLSEDEIYNLIFAPGFSTASTVTEVSGRGVGLDVVKRHIETLRGSTKVTSTPGKGSVFSIRLPLTLAIIDGMVVRMGTERFILPTASIVRMIRPHESTQTKLFDRNTVLSVGDDLVPLVRLDRTFGLPEVAAQAERSSAVIVEHEGRQCAFMVDELLGQQQVVIKPLGPSLVGLAGLSGGAIMPDGRVGLILDVAGLSKISGESSETPSADNRSALGRDRESA
ncbi:MAG: chemotaxis protein CheA [Planctomycetota bacterium]